jgi:Protein of unknown function (DUF4435)
MGPPGAVQLDRDVQRLHDRYWEDQRLAAGRKSVLLVEGDDDRDVIETFLQRRAATFETRVRVIPAGGRARVIARLKHTFPRDAHPNAYGLVDRDTWTDEEEATQIAAEPRLFVTEGWCLENVFFGPGAIRLCNDGVPAHLAQERERWVRAGALWWALQRAREAQQIWQEALGWSYGAPRADLDLGTAHALAESLKQKIPEDLRRTATLDVEVVAEAFARRSAEVLALSEDQQWRIGVHGKCAFSGLLVPAQRSTPQALRLHLAERIDRPAPIDELIAILLA